MRLKNILTVVILAGFGLLPLSVWAVEVDSEAATFGKGAHAFFAGEYQNAHDQLSDAVKAKSTDPRVYFFRGLAALRLNRPDTARADFKKGAQLEVSETNYFYDVNKSLRRVQGKERLMIESARKTAAAEYKKASQKRATQRYEATRIQEARVLRPLRIAEAAEFNMGSGSHNQSQTEEQNTSEAQPANPQSEPVPEVSGNIRFGRFFQALGSSIGNAIQGQIPGAGMPGMGMPSNRGAAPGDLGVPFNPGSPTNPGSLPVPAENGGTPWRSTVPTPRPATGENPFQDPNQNQSFPTPRTDRGESPFQNVPTPRTDRGENPFQGSSHRPQPAAEFANSEGIVHNLPNSDTLVVTFPTQPDPPRLAAVTPAPSFSMTDDPIPEEPTAVEEPAMLAQVAPEENMIETTPEEPAIEEPIGPEPEAVATNPTPSVEVEEPAIEDHPPVEPEPAPETVAKVEEPKESPEPEQVAVAETPVVEEPIEEPATPEVVEPVKPEPAPETVAKVEEPKESPEPEQLAMVEPTPEPIEPPLTEESFNSLAKLEGVKEAATVEEPSLEEDPFGDPIDIKTPGSNSLAMAPVEEDPFGNPTTAEKSVAVTKTPVAEKPDTKISDVAKNATVKKPVEKPVAPKPKRNAKPSGASALPSLDLNNLPPEDDPFA
ncbi:MAG: hypothetical protein PVH19_02975 [Planctomycetia bacterium]|jgi:hypothetical protein